MGSACILVKLVARARWWQKGLKMALFICWKKSETCFYCNQKIMPCIVWLISRILMWKWRTGPICFASSVLIHFVLMLFPNNSCQTIRVIISTNHETKNERRSESIRPSWRNRSAWLETECIRWWGDWSKSKYLDHMYVHAVFHLPLFRKMRSQRSTEFTKRSLS